MNKDVIVLILRELCKISYKNCKNSRLVCSYVRYDYIIKAIFKGYINKLVYHNISEKTITIDIPSSSKSFPDILPTDQEISDAIITDFVDISAKSNYDLWNYLKSKISEIIKTKLPKSDNNIIIRTRRVLYTEISIDLNTWEFLNYPIVKFNLTEQLFVNDIYRLFIMEQLYPTFNLIRCMFNVDDFNKTISLETQLRSFTFPKAINFVEALYFHDGIPDQVILYKYNNNRDNYQEIIINPTRKYFYLGMLYNHSSFYELSLRFQKNIKISIIGWIIQSIQALDYHKIVSSFYTENGIKSNVKNGTKINCRYFNGSLAINSNY